MLNSKHLTKVIRFLIESDDSFYNQPNRFISAVRDLYDGNIIILDDFVELIKYLSSDLYGNNIRFATLRAAVQRCNKNIFFLDFLKCLFLDKNIDALCLLESSLQSIYSSKKSSDDIKYDNSTTSSITSFFISNDRSIEYGGVIKLEWECINPFQIILKAGEEEMDVSGLSAMLISSQYDSYELFLYDASKKVIDTKRIDIRYRENAFCIKCGTLVLDEEDKFCTNCGFKL